ncbi:MAG TPA: tyrosine-protein phosphatase [Limnochordales bacterium]
MCRQPLAILFTGLAFEWAVEGAEPGRGIAMNLIEPGKGPAIPELKIPHDFYWVLTEPAPLAGMPMPRSGFPWEAVHAAGFHDVVSLAPGDYNPAPLAVSFAEELEDLWHGGFPKDEEREKKLIGKAVAAVLTGLHNGRGVLVHCLGGRGRTGTVLGCALRELGLPADTVVEWLRKVHHERDRGGWPESSWQEKLVREWTAGTPNE